MTSFSSTTSAAPAAVLLCVLLAACGADTGPSEDAASSTGGTESAASTPASTTTAASATSGATGTSQGELTEGSGSATNAASSSDASAGTTFNDNSSTGSDSSDASDSTQSATGSPSRVDVSEYEPTADAISIPAPGNNASGVTWNYDTDRVWVVQNGAGRFYEYPADDFSTPIRTLDLVGINANDTEGLAYIGNGEVAIAFEGGYGVYIADVPDGDADVSVPVKQTLTLAAPPSVGNNGLEGIAYDPDEAVFYAVGEGQDGAAPRRFFRFARPNVENEDFDWEDPELTVEEPFIADDVLPGSGASLDLAGIAFDARDGNVLIISHTGSRVIQLDPSGDGTILGELSLTPNQWEGIALVGNAGDLVLIAESNEMQRFSLPD